MKTIRLLFSCLHYGHFISFLVFVSFLYFMATTQRFVQTANLIWHCYFSINDRFDIPTTGTLYSRSRHVSIILLVTLLSFFVDLFLLETQKANQECC